MTNSLGSALPGFAAPRTQPAAPGKQGDSRFGKLLDGEPNMSGPESASEARPRGQRASSHPGREIGLGGKAKPGWTDGRHIAAAATNPTIGSSDAATRLPKHAAREDEAAPGDDSLPLQDRIPLLIALHELRRLSATTGEDPEGPGAANGESPALAGPPVTSRSKRVAVGHETASDRPTLGRTSVIDGPLAELGSPAAKLGHDASKPPTHGGVSNNESLTEGPAADVPGTPATRPDPAVGGRQGQRFSIHTDAERPSVEGARVDVVSERSFPVPSQAALSPAAVDVIDAVAADKATHLAASAPSAAPGLAGPGAAPMHSLKIELHPAELGMVTASLRLSGEQLSIELKPETEGAYRRLSADSEAIVKSLRGLGFEVDKVTIMQPHIAVVTPNRTDPAAALPAPPARDPSSSQSGNPGGHGGAGGQQAGRQSAGNQNDDAHGRSISPSRERAGDAVFI
jgi:chemotaxis protein MotD